MRKITLKTGAVIIIYSFILTAVFFSALFLFRSTSVFTIPTYYDNNQGVYILSSQEWVGGPLTREIIFNPIESQALAQLVNTI